MEIKFCNFAISTLWLYIAQVTALPTGSEKKITSCENFHCDVGQECYIKTSACGGKEPACRSGCDPTTCSGRCIKGRCQEDTDNKCALVLCAEGTRCVDGQCISLCDVIDCGPGQECYLAKPVNCSNQTCPPVEAACRLKDKCAVVRCSGDHYCDLGQCIKKPTCDGVKCPNGATCRLEEVQCFRAPCPPQPMCTQHA